MPRSMRRKTTRPLLHPRQRLVRRPETMDLADTVATALERSVLPAVIARGAGLRVVAVENGVAILEVTGSPGAVLPLASRIEALIRAAVPEITGARIIGPGAPPPAGAAGTLAERARRVLEAEVNPVIAA